MPAGLAGLCKGMCRWARCLVFDLEWTQVAFKSIVRKDLGPALLEFEPRHGELGYEKLGVSGESHAGGWDREQEQPGAAYPQIVWKPRKVRGA